jgi:mRNA interferase RelE/StbE
MKTYTIEFRLKALKQLKSLEKFERQRIAGALAILKTDPIPPNARRLKGSSNYRVRVGDYRVIYNIEGGKLKILVIAIAHRREIYLRKN